VDRLQPERQLTRVEADDAPCRQYIVRQREILTELTQRGGNVTEALRLLQILEELETLHEHHAAWLRREVGLC
jgi:hypothetical protein